MLPLGIYTLDYVDHQIEILGQDMMRLKPLNRHILIALFCVFLSQMLVIYQCNVSGCANMKQIGRLSYVCLSLNQILFKDNKETSTNNHGISLFMQMNVAQSKPLKFQHYKNKKLFSCLTKVLRSTLSDSYGQNITKIKL